jgi:hypothetical protein
MVRSSKHFHPVVSTAANRYRLAAAFFRWFLIAIYNRLSYQQA